MLAEDLKVREFLRTRLKNAAVSRILIERPAKNARITIFSARPGVVIGKKGEDIENLKAELAQAPRRAGGGQHRGDPQARDRRAADRRLDHAAAREAHHVPPRDEARDAERDAARRAGHQDHVGRPAERHRDRAHRVVPRRPRAAAHAEGRHRLRLLGSEDDLRRHRRQGLGLSRRPPGRRRSAGRDAARRRRRRSPFAPRSASGRRARWPRPSGRARAACDDRGPRAASTARWRRQARRGRCARRCAEVDHGQARAQGGRAAAGGRQGDGKGE